MVGEWASRDLAKVTPGPHTSIMWSYDQRETAKSSQSRRNFDVVTIQAFFF